MTDSSVPKVIAVSAASDVRVSILGIPGPRGLAGPAGADGDDGAPGANGAPGADGESVTVTVFTDPVAYAAYTPSGPLDWAILSDA